MSISAPRTDAAHAEEEDDRLEEENKTSHGGHFKQVPWSIHGDAGSNGWQSQRWGPDPLQKGRRHRATEE